MPRSRSIAIQSERARRRSPRALTSPASWIAPPNSSSFSVSVVLPASGCEMIAKVRRRAISSVRLAIFPCRGCELARCPLSPRLTPICYCGGAKPIPAAGPISRDQLLQPLRDRIGRAVRGEGGSEPPVGVHHIDDRAVVHVVIAIGTRMLGVIDAIGL